MIKTYGEPLPKTLSTFVEKHAAQIDEVGNEGLDGYWVYLRRGWCREEGLHCVHEWTVANVIEAWREVRPCACRDCRREA